MTSLVIKTTYGPVRGVQRTSHLGEEIYTFRGIPYAKPPVGPLRFKDPQPPEPWLLPRDATAHGRNAIHKAEFGVVGNDVSPNSDEDCLFLNVYTKEIKPQKPLPVMVWIHGGAFKMGSGDDDVYGPDYLLQKNVVFVSMNYRLGALGFLSINDPSVNVPGNAGLKDQALALKWVRANIDRFGGDATNVTLFGESAGAASVHFHMISELSRGLFDKAIVQSGSVLCNWTNYANANWAGRLAKKLGWTGEGGPRGAYDFLKEADAKDIILQQDDLLDPQERLKGVLAFGPVQEPYRSEQSFIDRPYADLLAHPWSVDVPLLIGGTSEEGLLYWRLFKAMTAVAQSPMGMLAHLSDSVLAVKPDAPEKVLSYYYGGEVPKPDDLMPLVKIWGDRSFWHGINATVASRVAVGGSGKTFVYRLAAKSNVLVHLKMVIIGENVEGVNHADDILYLFRPKMVTQVVAGSPEATTIDRMVSIWTHFAATGDPNAGVLDAIVWKAVESADDVLLQGLNIDTELSVIEFPEVPRIAFWNDILKV